MIVEPLYVWPQILKVFVNTFKSTKDQALALYLDLYLLKA